MPVKVSSKWLELQPEVLPNYKEILEFPYLANPLKNSPLLLRDKRKVKELYKDFRSEVSGRKKSLIFQFNFTHFPLKP